MTKHEEILSKMTPEQKIKATLMLISSTRELKAAALRVQNPNWSEIKINEEVKKIFLYASD